MSPTAARSRFIVFCTAGLFVVCGCESPSGLVEPAANVVAVEPGVEISIRIAPAALVLGSEGTWVTVHTDVPYGSAVNETLELSGIPAAFAYADDRGYLVVKFFQWAVEAIVSPPEATLTLTGAFTTGVPFYGTGTIVVKERNKGGRG